MECLQKGKTKHKMSAKNTEYETRAYNKFTPCVTMLYKVLQSSSDVVK